MESADRLGIEALLNEAIGRGFWDPLHDLDDIVIVAVDNGRTVGVASASVEPEPAEAGFGPIGIVKLVAVDPLARRRGIATRLVSEISAICEAHGARSLLAYAWVHGPGGTAPLAGALERTGYAFDCRLEDFYGGAVTGPCPACEQSPCLCPADVYRRAVPVSGANKRIEQNAER